MSVTQPWKTSAKPVVHVNTEGEFIGGGGAIIQEAPDYQNAAELLASFDNFSGVSAGDFVTLQKTSNGQAILSLSSSPLNTGESSVVVNESARMPCVLEIEGSMIRKRHSFASASLFANADTGEDIAPSPINITAIYQSNADNGAAYSAAAGTIVTINLESAIPDKNQPGAVYLSDWVHVVGLVDSRMNYQNLAIKYISPDRKTITAGFSDELALPSLAVPVINPSLGSAKLYFYNNAKGAANAAGFRFTGTTTTSSALFSIFGGGDAQISGTLFGDHRVTIGSTAPQYLNGILGEYELKATSRFRIEVRPDEVAFLDKAIDSTSALWSHRANRTAVKPSISAELKPRFRLYNPPGMSRPIAKIVSISKAGSTTATITTDVAHGLTTGNYITIKGVRDQTNFASITTPTQVAVLTATTFTIVHGSIASATSNGGSVILCNGGSDQPGIIGQYLSSVQAYSLNTSWLQVTGNASWSGISIGDYINLHGVMVDFTGADMGLDGAWEVASVSTTTLILKPIVNILGQSVSPSFSPSLGLTNCGGSVILRTTIRSHDLMLKTINEAQVMIDGQGTSRVDKGVPVNIVSGGITTVTANEGTPVSGTQYNVVTAASTNGALIKSTAGNFMEISISNLTAATIYVKLYNKATAPTVGTDVPVLTIPVSAGAFSAFQFGRFGKRFPTGIGIAVTGAAAATDTTVIAAGAQINGTYN